MRRARHVEAAGHPVQRGETQPQTFPELHWCKDQRASTGDTVRQQPPFERLVIVPDRVRRVDEKALIVIKHVSRHGGDKGENQVFGTKPRLRHPHCFSHLALPEREGYPRGWAISNWISAIQKRIAPLQTSSFCADLPHTY